MRTPNDLVYGETNRYPLFVNSAVRYIRYWLKLTRMEASKLHSRKKWVKHKLKTFSQIYICFVKSIQKTNHFANVKQKSMYKHQTSIFKPLVPSILPLFRDRIRLGHADIVDHSI